MVLRGVGEGYILLVSALPSPRGRLSAAVIGALSRPPSDTVEAGWTAVAPESDDDAALALWMVHELSYGGFEGVDPDHERSPALLAVRRRLEDQLEGTLRRVWPGPPDLDVVSGFFDWVASHDGPSLARHLQTDATREQAIELLKVRSVYHLKEADPTSFAIPRLPTAAKAAVVELQYDEYGVGDPTRLHSHLFALGLEASGLDPDYGTYVDDAPVEVLEQNNAQSMFGLQRRLRGAAMGHLAAFEATSSMPSRRMAQGLQRLGFPEEMVRYYTEHVEADAVHEQLAVLGICGGLLEAEPALTEDVWFGAWTCLHLEDRVAARLLDDWGLGDEEAERAG